MRYENLTNPYSFHSKYVCFMAVSDGISKLLNFESNHVTVTRNGEKFSFGRLSMNQIFRFSLGRLFSACALYTSVTWKSYTQMASSQLFNLAKNYYPVHVSLPRKVLCSSGQSCLIKTAFVCDQ